jgi:gentisate 1,2-dioxygenase
VEQQFKLYTETLKTQLEELDREKMELLENSKDCIKQLKKTNESLFAQLQVRQPSHAASPHRPNHSASQQKSRHERSIR